MNTTIPSAPVNTDAWPVLFAFLATVVLFVVFAICAGAFVLVIAGKYDPKPDTRTFLFRLFGVSTVGIFAGLVTGFLHVNPLSTLNDFQVKFERAQIKDAAVDNPPTPAATVATDKPTDKQTIFVQIGFESDRGQYSSLKSALPESKYNVPAVQVMGYKIAKSDIRYCNPVNKSDAEALDTLLATDGFLKPDVLQISKCDPNRNKNILEVWLKSSQ